MRSPEDYDLAVCVAPFQVTLSSRLAPDRFQSAADSSLRGLRVDHRRDLQAERPRLRTRQDQEQFTLALTFTRQGFQTNLPIMRVG